VVVIINKYSSILGLLIMLFLSQNANSQTTADLNSIAGQMDSLFLFNKRFDDLKSDKEFRKFYIELLDFKSKLSRKIQDSLMVSFPQVNMDSVSLKMDSIGLILSNKMHYLKYVKKEQGSFFLFMDNLALLKKAKTTAGEGDDLFIKTIIFTYDEYGEIDDQYSNPCWMHERSYVSVSSRLGDFSTLKYYKRITSEFKKNKVFRVEMKTLIDNFINNFTLSSFDYSKEKVLKELIELQKYDPTINKLISNYIYEINTSNFQFECNFHDCEFEN
jgi:hypothetical protein